MIISRGRRYIFVQAPKTGGTALALALEAKVMKDDILIGDTPKAIKRRKRLKGVTASGRLWKHSALSDIYGLVTEDEIAAFFVFMLVRNPWDRMVSYYHWLLQQSFDHPAVTLAGSLDFSGFLNHPDTIRAFEANPFTAYVTDRHGAERCDLFLRLEYLADDVQKLEAQLQMRLPALEYANKSDRLADWRGYYSDADAALLGRICQADIARFGYRFDPR